ncbi:hypothetical protein N7669_00200 [Stenotrophomonas sp. GD03997]|nr:MULTISPECIES: hypothetical protein [unclassified Stenotrophomonas]MDG9841885.1 hypothetical protein [Stenotrophomonas sp. GD04054]MDH0015681.1 hypothetical protein [Stenotrophomonas sp. GD04028]MDH0574407.1 hypothetical protein [Stenotrophomonas sp. GD03997]MDH0858831.1 hypothetical protein [Stenotrophomonas sp. GD03882]
MIRTVSHGVLLSAMVASVCAASTASASSVSLIKAAEQASLIESRYSAGGGRSGGSGDDPLFRQ